MLLLSFASGGTGDVAYAACSKYPDMKITVLDLPQVVQCSSHFRPSKDECPNQDNVTFVEGDFFDGPLPTADLYVLTRVLHDWSDEKIDIILKNVYNSLPSGIIIYLYVCRFCIYCWKYQYMFKKSR